jgi:hypothetical protein
MAVQRTGGLGNLRWLCVVGGIDFGHSIGFADLSEDARNGFSEGIADAN